MVTINYVSKYQQVKTTNTNPTEMHDTAESAVAQLPEGSITNIYRQKTDPPKPITANFLIFDYESHKKIEK